MSAANGTTEKASSEGGNILSGQNPIQFNLSDPLPLFIVQTVIILSLCYFINIFMHRIRQPKVVSEVISGIILGPSIMGKIPGFNDTIFPSESIPFLTLVANLGLCLFLFLVGLELDPKLILKRAKHALGISVAGLLIPFVFSCGVALLLYKEFEKGTDTGPAPPFGQFLLTCGVAMSLTAFPVLARILAEMQLMSTTVGFITVCAAAAGDIVAWILLALLVSLINATTPIMPLYVILMGIGLCLILAYVVRPILMSLVRLTHSEEEPSQKMIAVTLVIVLSTSFITNIIGIHTIFGGFLVGLLIPHDSGFAEGLTRRLEDLVGVYFLPIFFACSGLKTQVGLLNNGQTWGLVIMVTVISMFGKMLGCTTAAKANGMTWREAFSIGFLMQCKGLVEYIILNIGHDAGVISDRVFVIMIAMCVILTMISTPFVGYLYPVSYQKELEVKREAERKRMALPPKGHKDDIHDTQAKRGGFFSKLTSKLRRRRGDKDMDKEKHQEGYANSGSGLEDLDSVRIDGSTCNADLNDMEEAIEQPWKARNSIMFCLDKTPNAPGVMTLLQLFSGAMIRSRVSHPTLKNGDAGGQTGKPGRNSENGKQYLDVLQPSIDISDPHGNSRTTNVGKSGPECEINFSKIYAIRLLQISERTSAAMLTASRCMDRLYKDTVMMMVMAFAKLNSIPLKPLVAISTDAAESTVAQNILDRAEDLSVGWIVFPWNSSHLVDLPSYAAGQTSNENHLDPGIMLSMANTAATGISTMSMPGSPSMAHDSVPPGAPPLGFPYNISRYFDHDEAQKIASGGHVDLSQGGASHRTSIASNTKVLSKLIPSSADSNISTAVLVDRGLGLFGGVEHMVVPLLGGEDDFEALCLASCLARSAQCFVTILRISSAPQGAQQLQSTPHSGAPSQTFQLHGQQSPRSRQFSSDRSAPPTPGAAGLHSRDSSQQWTAPVDTTVPKDDETLYKKFFPSKPPFLGGHNHRQQRILQRNVSLSRVGYNLLDENIDENELEEGIMTLNFQELSDAIQWARTYLTAQDLMIMGFDSNALSTQTATSQSMPSPRQQAVGISRVPSMEGAHLSSPDSRILSNPTSASPPSILERRGLSLSPPRSDISHRIQSLHDLTSNALTTSTPGLSTAGQPLTPQPRASFDEERLGRPAAIDATDSDRSRSKETRSMSSLSRGRRAETPAASGGSIHTQAHSSHTLTTCQVMLGIAADKMMQSSVISSLLVVRSRWFSQRKQSRSHHQDFNSPLSQFRLHTVSTGGSHYHTYHGRESSDPPSLMQHNILDQARQYHSQQQQHHARERSRLSQEVIQDLEVAHAGPSSAADAKAKGRDERGPDVTFADEKGESGSTDVILGRTAGAGGERNLGDFTTPRMSHESA